MKIIVFSIPFLLLLNACAGDEEPKPLDAPALQEPTESTEPPPNSVATTMAPFMSYAHQLSGKVVVYADNDKKQFLRLENFYMTSGPDVYVFLSKSNNYSAANTIPITMLKGDYSNSNLSLTIDQSIDLKTHRFVLVYCVQYNSLFGFAEPK